METKGKFSEIASQRKTSFFFRCIKMLNQQHIHIYMCILCLSVKFHTTSDSLPLPRPSNSIYTGENNCCNQPPQRKAQEYEKLNR